MTDKLFTNPKLSLINVPALNYLLRSEIFVNNRQLRVVHLILDFEPISRSFLDVGNSIRAGNHRLARIDVSRPDFLAPYDLPPVNHPIPQGIPPVAQPLQQVPLGETIIGEGTTSSSSLEQEIDKFQFEEETILISEAEEGADEHSCVQTPAQVVTYIADTSDEEETMAPKTGPSLKELVKNRNKAPSPQDKNKSKPPANPPPPPPQIPADLGLKPNPDLRRKRPVDAVEEGELGPSKGNKQARQIQDHMGRRSSSVDNREEAPVAQVRRAPRTWSPILEVDGMPIAFDATLRHYRRRHAGLMAKSLQQPLLLPQDMVAYRSFNHPDLFLSLKRDLAMVSNSTHFSFIYVYLHFITEATLSLHILGYATNLCGRGVGQELSQ